MKIRSFSFEDVVRATIVIALHRPDLIAGMSPRDTYTLAMEYIHMARAELLLQRGLDPVIEETK